VSISKARELLRKAELEKPGLNQNLMLAAALTAVLKPAPVIVGGTAEEFWGGHEYHETDLDLVGFLTAEGRATLRDLGFEAHGRHWVRPGSGLVVEFPEERIDGDENRIETRMVGGGLITSSAWTICMWTASSKPPATRRRRTSIFSRPSQWWRVATRT